MDWVVGGKVCSVVVVLVVVWSVLLDWDGTSPFCTSASFLALFWSLIKSDVYLGVPGGKVEIVVADFSIKSLRGTISAVKQYNFGGFKNGVFLPLRDSLYPNSNIVETIINVDDVTKYVKSESIMVAKALWK